MKTHHLIFLATALFVTLFYNESLGLNLGILGIATAVLTYFSTKKRFQTKTFFALFVTSIFSSFAFAWYGDFVSFLAVFTSLFLLSFISKNRELKSLFVIPVFALNFVTFIYRFFQFEKWLPQKKTDGFGQKMIAVVLIPVILLLVFFGIYAQGSSHFASLFSDYEWDLDVWQVLVLGALGFFLAFNFFNYSVYDFFYQQNHHLKNDFLNEDKTLKPTYSFLDLNSERLSGIVSLAGLNILLVFFIITFNYEQFVEIPKSPNQLSAETHERVGAVIASILMAITVIMFYFKSSFNFDEKAKSLKMLAKIWIFLNAVLVISAFAKNSEYVMNLGLTYKILGVYAFLTLSIVGLVFTFFKIQKQKTNAYLFNHMFWYFYGTILVCSFINWGGLATHYNIKNHKGSYPFLETLNFNDQILKENFPNEEAKYNDYEPQVNEKSTFLSKILYYEMLR